MQPVPQTRRRPLRTPPLPWATGAAITVRMRFKERTARRAITFGASWRRSRQVRWSSTPRSRKLLPRWSPMRQWRRQRECGRRRPAGTVRPMCSMRARQEDPLGCFGPFQHGFFAHHSARDGSSCSSAGETALHKLAKKVLDQRSEIALPEMSVSAEDDRELLSLQSHLGLTDASPWRQPQDLVLRLREFRNRLLEAFRLVGATHCAIRKLDGFGKTRAEART